MTLHKDFVEFDHEDLNEKIKQVRARVLLQARHAYLVDDDVSREEIETAVYQMLRNEIYFDVADKINQALANVRGMLSHLAHGGTIDSSPLESTEQLLDQAMAICYDEKRTNSGE